MVYRSSKRPPQSEDEFQRMHIDSDEGFKDAKFQSQPRLWKPLSIILILICVGLTIGIILISTDTLNGNKSNNAPLCGANKKKFQRIIDHSEPENPDPFHDLTQKEITNLFRFLEKDPAIKVTPIDKATALDAIVYMMDLFPAKKADVEAFLSGKKSQPTRQARAVIFRPDLKPPLVQEFICGPLPDVKECNLLESNSRRNPVDYALRPVLHTMELRSFGPLFESVDKQIGYILRESYGMSFANCDPEECLRPFPAPVGSKFVGDLTSRYVWVSANYPIEYYVEYSLDFLMLVRFGDPDPNKHYVAKIWYHGQFFESVDDFIRQYNSNSIQKTKMRPPKLSSIKESISSLYQTGDPYPEVPQRPPTLVEKDGKRYSLKNKEVDYLGWKFNFRMSSITGPSLSNIRYRGERIAYELSLQDVAVFYASDNPEYRVTNYIDSGALLGMKSRTLIPGADCPETATYIPQTFSSIIKSEPLVVKHGFCLFENNFGYPLRRHSSYHQFEGGFYGGMLNSALVLRAIMTVTNYDYVIDFIFHQSGAIETQVLSTGYILATFFREEERPYGFQTEENFLAPIHHHMFHFKADLDISGKSNRYETLEIRPETVKLRFPKDAEASQIRFSRNLKNTEQEALYNFNFEKPKYHIVHNNEKKTKYGEPKAFRIHLDGMSKQLITENVGNEATVAWARHQLVVTKHKDDELTSTSEYAMFDSLDPVVNFTKFYDDNDSILDEDLVFWIAMGVHHIPHTEDLPITPTVGNQQRFFLLPYNYFPRCPSFNSRDHIRIELKDKNNYDAGLSIDRHGYSDDQCIVPQVATAFDELLEKSPDVAIDPLE